jgi:hypothetical protein
MKLPVFASPMRARATDPARQLEQPTENPEPIDPTAEILAGRAPVAPARPAATALGSSRSLEAQPRIAGPSSGWYRKGSLA